MDMVESIWQSDGRGRAIRELLRGRDYAAKLKTMLSTDDKNLVKTGASAVPAADDLVAKILGSFSETLSLLKSMESDPELSLQVPPAKANAAGVSWAGSLKSEDSGESCRSTSAFKDRRGCYKRRKTSDTWTKETSTLVDDGHAWRKYGQKVILNAKYPRNYYRCTHKFDQKCQATKQVQQVGEDPPVYKTTYHGRHTCRNMLKAAPQIIVDNYSTGRDGSSFLLSFESNRQSGDVVDGGVDLLLPSFTSPSSPSFKREEEEEDGRQSSTYSFCDYYPSPADYLTSTFESSAPVSGLSSGSDYGDVINSSEVYSFDALNFEF